MNPLARLIHAVADYTIGTVIVIAHVALAQRRLPPRSFAR